jgi:thioredoxin 1
MIEIKEETVTNFNEEIARGISLVDFTATWCGPCKMQLAILQEIEKQTDNIAKFIKINIDDEQSIAKSLEVKSVPTIAIFKDGILVKKLIGLQRKDNIITELTSI